MSKEIEKLQSELVEVRRRVVVLEGDIADLEALSHKTIKSVQAFLDSVELLCHPSNAGVSDFPSFRKSLFRNVSSLKSHLSILKYS